MWHSTAITEFFFPRRFGDRHAHFFAIFTCFCFARKNSLQFVFVKRMTAFAANEQSVYLFHLVDHLFGCKLIYAFRTNATQFACTGIPNNEYIRNEVGTDTVVVVVLVRVLCFLLRWHIAEIKKIQAFKVAEK